VPEHADRTDPITIVHRFGPRGVGLELLLAPMVPGATLVPWPGPGDVLVSLDSAWDGEPRDATEIPPEIGWSHLLSTGVGNFPIPGLKGRPLTNSKGASSPAIAEFVLAAMLTFEKQIPEVWRNDPPPRWGMASLGGLQGKTLGLVGIGTIGTEVARRALAFDMEVLALRRSGAPSTIPGVDITTTLDDLMARADHLVIAAPATPETHHMIDAAALGHAKPGLHLINVARGTLVDQDALIAALDRGSLGGATLDVADPEPLPAGHPLYGHPKIRLSPHVSWSSPRTIQAMLDVFLDNLDRWRDGRPLVGTVDVDAGY
jgi:phosphoglycerate dehydrogenase-like enzyme